MVINSSCHLLVHRFNEFRNHLFYLIFHYGHIGHLFMIINLLLLITDSLFFLSFLLFISRSLSNKLLIPKSLFSIILSASLIIFKQFSLIKKYIQSKIQFLDAILF